MEFKRDEVLNSQCMEARRNDVTLVCEDIKIPANKTILCAVSNYFRTLFQDGMMMDNVPIPMVAAEHMKIILLFIYTGKFEVEDQDLAALIAASHFLELHFLTECCFNRLSQILNCDNFLDLYYLSSRYYEEGIELYVVPFLAQNFEEIVKREQFLELRACEMQKIYRQVDTFKCPMDIAIKALFQWAEAGENRENTILEILPLINLRGLSTEFLIKSLHERALVKKNSHILTLMSEEVMTRTSSLTLKNIEKPKKHLLLAFGCDDEKKHVLKMYDVNKNQWSPPQMLPFRVVVGMCMAWYGGHVYVFGGEESHAEVSESFITSTNVIKYCPTNNRITAFGALTVGVCYAGAGVLDDYIYVVNGVNEYCERVCTVQRYDPVTGTCVKVASTKESHLCPFVLPYSKHLLFLGSLTDDNTIERYDPEVDQWTTITQIPREIRFCSAALYKKKLIILRKVLTSEFQMYNLTSEEWQAKRFDGCPRIMHEIYSTRFKGKCILLVRDDKNVLHSFDPESEEWLRESTPNDEPWNCYQTCFAYM